ncbi:chorismate mutase / prephenate dehydrogenase [Candidatus Methanoplasma termitum]|uniref:AroQ protein n=1 Tax=Candidatus Methanoplasma termitum TaxID=1577791 RepID=A0A0A7LCL2_9ARCH|nr:prephenate dehydrogenase/arogenate dehydrogenase family protein [Candidatus Methanoplasma termitum]AIZ56915.1 chorismate mutase / prephenate dehydrogenase [Candidatus Methanoplasma termitum]MCL2333686.1 prephenate dehydrogenase/arogenate dehydrogenase family protein [Candidatus Methanoplasma sp.]
MKDLEQLRKEIEKIDSELIRLMIKRNEIAKEVGLLKNKKGIGLRNIDVEKKVMERYRRMSENTLLPPDVAEAICKLLIDSSVELQSGLLNKKCEKKISIVGGSGGMGQWMKRYFERMGAEVNIIGRSSGSPTDAEDSDVVIISVPPSAISATLKKMVPFCKEDALIFDISSIKSPFADDIKEMAKHRKVCSVHHMFGPSAKTMLDRNVVICDCGCKEAVSEVADLFDSEGSNLIFTSIERHDELMAYVLAFAHASNIVFFTTLRESGISFDELNKIASTTFKRCLNASVPVSEENAPLYHEIQRLNDNIDDMWDVFEKAFKEVKKASLSKDPDRFIEIMESGKEYFSDHQ